MKITNSIRNVCQNLEVPAKARLHPIESQTDEPAIPAELTA
ncbi:hypothetical protein [Streptomyces tubercidicus]